MTIQISITDPHWKYPLTSMMRCTVLGESQTLYRCFAGGIDSRPANATCDHEGKTRLTVTGAGFGRTNQQPVASPSLPLPMEKDGATTPPVWSDGAAAGELEEDLMNPGEHGPPLRNGRLRVLAANPPVR